jgi:hypothetical protein
LGPAVAADVLHISQSYVCVHAHRGQPQVQLHCIAADAYSSCVKLRLLMQMTDFSDGVIGFALLRVSPSALFAIIVHAV